MTIILNEKIYYRCKDCHVATAPRNDVMVAIAPRNDVRAATAPHNDVILQEQLSR